MASICYSGTQNRNKQRERQAGRRTHRQMGRGLKDKRTEGQTCNLYTHTCTNEQADKQSQIVETDDLNSR